MMMFTEEEYMEEKLDQYNKSEKLEQSGKNSKLGVIVFCLALISSAVYAIYLKQNEHEIFYRIHSYFLYAYTVPLSAVLCFNLFTKYLKRVAIVYILSCFLLTYPLAIICVFTIIFSYGFTISSFILLYGLKGIIVSVALYGIQGILISNLLLKLGLQRGKIKWDQLLKSLLYLGIIVLMDLLSILIFQYIRIFIV